jgi:hypothetical protein
MLPYVTFSSLLVLPEQQFYDSMFELADVWCEDIEAGEYVDFLGEIFLNVVMEPETEILPQEGFHEEIPSAGWGGDSSAPPPQAAEEKTKVAKDDEKDEEKDEESGASPSSANMRFMRSVNKVISMLRAVTSITDVFDKEPLGNTPFEFNVESFRFSRKGAHGDMGARAPTPPPPPDEELPDFSRWNADLGAPLAPESRTQWELTCEAECVEKEAWQLLMRSQLMEGCLLDCISGNLAKGGDGKTTAGNGEGEEVSAEETEGESKEEALEEPKGEVEQEKEAGGKGGDAGKDEGEEGIDAGVGRKRSVADIVQAGEGALPPVVKQRLTDKERVQQEEREEFLEQLSRMAARVAKTKEARLALREVRAEVEDQNSIARIVARNDNGTMRDIDRFRAYKTTVDRCSLMSPKSPIRCGPMRASPTLFGYGPEHVRGDDEDGKARGTRQGHPRARPLPSSPKVSEQQKLTELALRGNFSQSVDALGHALVALREVLQDIRTTVAKYGVDVPGIWHRTHPGGGDKDDEQQTGKVGAAFCPIRDQALEWKNNSDEAHTLRQERSRPGKHSEDLDLISSFARPSTATMSSARSPTKAQAVVNSLLGDLVQRSNMPRPRSGYKTSHQRGLDRSIKGPVGGGHFRVAPKTNPLDPTRPEVLNLESDPIYGRQTESGESLSATGRPSGYKTVVSTSGVVNAIDRVSGSVGSMYSLGTQTFSRQVTNKRMEGPASVSRRGGGGGLVTPEHQERAAFLGSPTSASDRDSPGRRRVMSGSPAGRSGLRSARPTSARVVMLENGLHVLKQQRAIPMSGTDHWYLPRENGDPMAGVHGRRAQSKYNSMSEQSNGSFSAAQGLRGGEEGRERSMRVIR